MSADVAGALARVRERIAAAARRAGRDPAAVTLVAVSKGHGAEAVRAAMAAGQRVFGENYAQELAEKAAALADAAPVWHFVGRLQRNKARFVVGRAALIHTVDSIPLAGEIDRRAAASGAGVAQEMLVQVSLAGEAQKGGVPPDALPALLEAARHSAHVRCVGLMTMTPFEDEPERARPYYRALRELAARFALPQLSMGMSSDFAVAIEEGATLVRVGTAIFGPRP